MKLTSILNNRAYSKRIIREFLEIVGTPSINKYNNKAMETTRYLANSGHNVIIPTLILKSPPPPRSLTVRGLINDYPQALKRFKSKPPYVVCSLIRHDYTTYEAAFQAINTAATNDLIGKVFRRYMFNLLAEAVTSLTKGIAGKFMPTESTSVELRQAALAVNLPDLNSVLQAADSWLDNKKASFPPPKTTPPTIST